MSVTSIEHVLVLSDDIDATRDFYCAVLGLAVGERPPLAFPGYWLYAGTTACVHVAERRPYATHAAGLGLMVPDRDPGVGPVDHIAFTAGDYDELVERLERRGVAAVTNAVPGGPRQVFIEDPNGVRVEINVKEP
jgi:catechol 2,3-dioxygenase-like lactoylglutathione lyase family enzyme